TEATARPLSAPRVSFRHARTHTPTPRPRRRTRSPRKPKTQAPSGARGGLRARVLEMPADDSSRAAGHCRTMVGRTADVGSLSSELRESTASDAFPSHPTNVCFQKGEYRGE